MIRRKLHDISNHLYEVCVRIRAFFHRPQNRIDRHGLTGKRIDNNDIQPHTRNLRVVHWLRNNHPQRKSEDLRLELPHKGYSGVMNYLFHRKFFQ